MYGKNFVLTALLGLLGSFAQAQQMTATSVVFRGAGSYAQVDLESVAGLHAGSRMTLADIQAAAQRLADSGCFDEVKVDSKGPASALTVIFLLKASPASEIHPAAFLNLVWFTPQELGEILHKAAPLSAVGLFETTGVLDRISESLVSALQAKGVSNAVISHTVAGATSIRPKAVVMFRVQRPYVRVGTLVLDGVSAALAPAEAKVTSQMHGRAYADGDEPFQTRGLLLGPYLNQGYLDTHLEDVRLKLRPGSAEDVDVDVTAKVVGDATPYRVSYIRFAGTPVVTADVWSSAAKLHPGDVASREQLLASIDPIDRAYHKLGYMDEYVNPGTKLDHAAHTVNYDLTVVPGEVYRLHDVAVQGLTPEARAEFDQIWSMHPGDPYDSNYVHDIVTGNRAMRHLATYTGSFEAAADPSTHLVDLTIVFAQTPSKR